jgi:hypothetical protein
LREIAAVLQSVCGRSHASHSADAHKKNRPACRSGRCFAKAQSELCSGSGGSPATSRRSSVVPSGRVATPPSTPAWSRGFRLGRVLCLCWPKVLIIHSLGPKSQPSSGKLGGVS